MTTHNETDQRLAALMAGRSGNDKLAIDGGAKVRSAPWPARRLFGEEEKRAAIALFDQCIEQGEAFGYNGAEEEGYCREFCALMGGGHADAVNSGSSAVYVALRALEIEPFTEVIVPPVSDAGGFMPVPLTNCIPIPADSAPNSFNAGPEQIERRITPLTRAIIVAHIAGHPADMDPIMEIARPRGIKVIEDCAQSHGATYKGRPVGTIGNVAAFSTMFGKHHATGGQGGVVYTQDQEMYWRIRRCADRGKPFGLERETTNVTASLNFNLNELSAAIGREQLKKLPGIVAARRKIAALFDQACRTTRTLRLNTGLSCAQGSYWFLVIAVELGRLSTSKDRFVEAVNAEGIPLRQTYAHTLLDASWYRNRSVFGTSGFPWTCPLYKGDASRPFELANFRATDATHVTLPIHERCGEHEAADFAAAVAKVEREFAR